MWIIPNNFRACPSARDMAASRLDSNEQAFACAQSLMWRGKHSPQRTWSQRLKREKWLRLLSGRMLRPSLSQTFTAEWASCLPVIPASRSARQAKEKEKQTSATCGHSLQGELPLASPDLCSAKMSRDTLPLGLRTFLATWGQWVTATRQDYLARRKSAQATEGNGCSGWPTPAAHEPRLGYQNRNNGKKGSQKSLTTVVIEAGQPVQANPSTTGKNPGQWPTPLENDHWITNQPRKDNRQEQLPQMVQKWPTPTSNAVTGGQTGMASSSTTRRKLEKTLGRAESLKLNRKLNPNWVEQLMGLNLGRTQLPTEWTGCDSLATESFHKQQQRHSQHYGND